MTANQQIAIFQRTAYVWLAHRSPNITVVMDNEFFESEFHTRLVAQGGNTGGTVTLLLEQGIQLEVKIEKKKLKLNIILKLDEP